jgi:hypothetical protein
MPTLKKIKKIGESHPPRDIRENTKARREWLAAEHERLQYEGKVAKIVGTGSYQHISIYKETNAPGRIQQRGTCQVCGGSHALDGTLIVLHGYERPGLGWINGRCSGVDSLPAEWSNTLTKVMIANTKLTLDSFEQQIQEAFNREQMLFHNRDNTPGHIKAHKEAVSLLSALKTQAFAAKQYIKHLESNVLPQLGKPITEVIVPS